MGMSDKTNENNPKLESYIVYGMICGLFIGSIFGTIGIINGNVLLAVSCSGFGSSFGVLAGVLLYSIKKRNS